MTAHTNFIASILAGATAEFAVLPICTIQTNYQTQKTLNTNERINVTNITKKLYHQYGLRGFYNASFSAISGQMISTGAKYTIYKSIQNYRNTPYNDMFNNSMNGIMSGVASILFTQPFDTFKNYQQRHADYFSDIKKNAFVMYRGTKQSILKCTALGALLYPTNDLCNTHIDNTLLASIATSFLISPILHPIDLLKRRNMAGEKLWMGPNPIHYYRGIVINMCRTTPHFAVSMLTINYVKKLIE